MSHQPSVIKLSRAAPPTSAATATATKASVPQRRQSFDARDLTDAELEAYMTGTWVPPQSMHKEVSPDEPTVSYGQGEGRRVAYIENPFYQPRSQKAIDEEKRERARLEAKKEKKRLKEEQRRQDWASAKPSRDYNRQVMGTSVMGPRFQQFDVVYAPVIRVPTYRATHE